MRKFSAAAKSAALNSFKELSEVVDGKTLPKTIGPLFFLRRDMNHNPKEYDAFLKAVNPNKQAFLFFDGASKSNPGPAGAGFVLADELNNVYGGFSVNLLRATNNEAEYMAALFGVYCAHLANIQNLTVIGDSSLVIGQLTGRMQLKAPNLQHYYYPLHHLCKQFAKVEFTHVERKVNAVADQLANKAVKKYIELSLAEKADLARITQEFRKTLLENPTSTDPTKLGEALAQDASLKKKLGEDAAETTEDGNLKQ